MNDRDLYGRILGLTKPWIVTNVVLDMTEKAVTVFVDVAEGTELRCPECDVACSRYDTRANKWRHLDTCQLQTIIYSEIPRTNCPTHGARQVKVPWADDRSRFTALFECLVIDLLKIAPISVVASRTGLSWAQVDGILKRAVARGLGRRKLKPCKRIGVDETSFKRRHEYVTVVTDLDGQTVRYVGDDRTTDSLETYYRQQSSADLAALDVVAMDMWEPYIQSTLRHVQDANDKIAFDKFHVAKHLGDAVDRVRREENRELLERGDKRLVGTKYLWLFNPENMSPDRWFGFAALRNSTLKVARAWAVKESAMCLWHYISRGWAKRQWTLWIRWALRSRQEPIRRVARMVKTHLYGILNAIVLKATNAAAESTNSRIQKIKAMACGFRNKARFKNAIYFHLGGLDLSPSSIHPNS